MTETEFYALIDAARNDAAPDAPSADPEALHDVLSALPDGEVAAFATEFRRQMVRLNRWSVWDAGYAASGGLSDDAFHYFRTWLIGKGAEVVELALTRPDELVPYLDTDELENEALEYVADEARGTDHADAEPAGEPFDEDTSAERHPKLAAWFDEVGAGPPLGADDVLIAGHARAGGLTVVTNNVREFERVPGLLVEDWSEPA